MKANILIIDDEESIRFTYKQFLAREGYHVFTAADIPEAEKILSEYPIDLVYADIILKNASGLDIPGFVRSKGCRSPIIFMTGMPSVDNAAKSVRLGAFDYLIKPVSRETLTGTTQLALLKRWFQQKQSKINDEKEKYKRNLDLIFKNVKDGIITVDRELKIVEANTAVKTICAIDIAEAKSTNFHDIVCRCSKSCIKILQQALDSHDVVQDFRIECEHCDFNQQVVVINASPLFDQNNKFIGGMLVVRDISRITKLEQELLERHQFHNIIGKSSAMQKYYQLIEDLADVETTVLITGESGTGKELIARAIHYSGNRAFQPMVTVNCSALPENLLESELFGHVKGAFTGAIKDKKGRFQLADKGTIFLDEIGDISPLIQLKLLRVLQEKEFERVGDSTPVKVDVRLITSTNADLKDMVQQGRFREDLYYRLKVIEIELPPLRDRKEDIPLLVDHFCQLFNKKFNKHIQEFSSRTLTLLINYRWPGNIRELRHVIEHAFVLCREQVIDIQHLPHEIATGARTEKTDPSFFTEDDDLLTTLEKTDWNKAKTARLLGISRQTLYRKIRQLKQPSNLPDLLRNTSVT